MNFQFNITVNPVVIYSPNTDIIFCLLLVSTIGYAAIFKTYRKNFVQILKSVNDSNLSDQLYRENSRATSLTILFLASLSTLVIGAFLSWSTYRLDVLAGLKHSTVLFAVLGVALFVMFRFTVLNVIGLISQRKQLLDYGLFVFWTILCFLGPLLTVISAFAVFGPIESQHFFVWLGLILVLLAYLLFGLRGVMICLNEKGIGPLNLIYYFCALEIMPVLLAYRTLLS